MFVFLNRGFLEMSSQNSLNSSSIVSMSMNSSVSTATSLLSFPFDSRKSSKNLCSTLSTRV